MAIEQRLANDGLQSKSGPPPTLVNEGLLEYSSAICLHAYGSVLPSRTELSPWGQRLTPAKPRPLPFSQFSEKVG